MTLDNSLSKFEASLARCSSTVGSPKMFKYAPIVRYIFCKLQRMLDDEVKCVCDITVRFPGKETNCYTYNATMSNIGENPFFLTDDHDWGCFLIRLNNPNGDSHITEAIGSALSSIFHELSEHARLCLETKAYRETDTLSAGNLRNLQKYLSDVTYRVRGRVRQELWFNLQGSVPNKLVCLLKAILADMPDVYLPSPEERWTGKRDAFSFPIAEYLARNISENEHRVLLLALTLFKEYAITDPRDKILARNMRLIKDKKICAELIDKIYPGAEHA